MHTGCAQNFNLTLMLWRIPIPTHKKMLGGSKEKMMCHTSERFHVIILITRNLTDTRRSKNIQKERRIRIQHRLDKQDF